MIRAILWVLVAVLSGGAAEWTTLENCHLIPNQYNDGDSFLVESSTSFRGSKVNRFRLYFVDTAETSADSDFMRKRLADQAAYWGSHDARFAQQMGTLAKQQVNNWLRGGFTIHTRSEKAPGLGRPRYYALVRVGSRWLDELLVSHGLVRVYGKGTDLPDHSRDQTHWARLRLLERAAKSARKNGWKQTP